MPTRIRVKPLTILQSESLARIPWLLHGFSTRLGGSSKIYGGALNLGFTKQDSRLTVERNRRAFLNKLGANTMAARGPWSRCARFIQTSFTA